MHLVNEAGGKIGKRRINFDEVPLHFAHVPIGPKELARADFTIVQDDRFVELWIIGDVLAESFRQAPQGKLKVGATCDKADWPAKVEDAPLTGAKVVALPKSAQLKGVINPPRCPDDLGE